MHGAGHRAQAQQSSRRVSPFLSQRPGFPRAVRGSARPHIKTSLLPVGFSRLGVRPASLLLASTRPCPARPLPQSPRGCGEVYSGLPCTGQLPGQLPGLQCGLRGVGTILRAPSRGLCHISTYTRRTRSCWRGPSGEWWGEEHCRQRKRNCWEDGEEVRAGGEGTSSADSGNTPGPSEVPQAGTGPTGSGSK